MAAAQSAAPPKRQKFVIPIGPDTPTANGSKLVCHICKKTSKSWTALISHYEGAHDVDNEMMIGQFATKQAALHKIAAKKYQLTDAEFEAISPLDNWSVKCVKCDVKLRKTAVLKHFAVRAHASGVKTVSKWISVVDANAIHNGYPANCVFELLHEQRASIAEPSDDRPAAPSPVAHKVAPAQVAPRPQHQHQSPRGTSTSTSRPAAPAPAVHKVAPAAPSVPTPPSGCRLIGPEAVPDDGPASIAAAIAGAVKGAVAELMPKRSALPKVKICDEWLGWTAPECWNDPDIQQRKCPLRVDTKFDLSEFQAGDKN